MQSVLKIKRRHQGTCLSLLLLGSVHLAAAQPKCDSFPGVPAPPSVSKRVTDFGATPDDLTDDTAAIQKALDSLNPGDSLIFPPGQYIQGSVIRSRVNGVMLHGKGATLHATNPSQMAFMISGDNTGVFDFTFTAATDGRKTYPEAARLAIVKIDSLGKKQQVKNIRIQGNSIINAGAPDSKDSNSSSSSGIFIYKVSGFLIAGNVIQRSLADGIFITGGSHDGLVTQNVVRETGDDLIAVVSYGGSTLSPTDGSKPLEETVRTMIAGALSTNVAIINNDVSGNYWGRGITVVGGEAVTISGNKISNVAGGAGILLSREYSYGTMGVNNVVVDGNFITNIQNLPPDYNPGHKYKGVLTRQGAIELQSFIYDDEMTEKLLADALSVQNIRISKNKISNINADGIRTGLLLKGSWPDKRPGRTEAAARRYSSGIVRNVSILDNSISKAKYGIRILENTDKPTVYCQRNTPAGNTGTDSAECKASEPNTITGSSICGAASLPR